MAKQEDKEELKKALAQIKKEDRAESVKQAVKEQKEKTSALGKKEKSGTGTSSEKNTQKRYEQKRKQAMTHGWKQQLTVGMPAMLIDTVLLFLGTYIFSLLYKAFVVYEISTGQDALSSIIFYVSPVTGFLGILLLFVLKNVYDARFYRIQMWAKERRRKLLRVGEWVLYVFVMAVFEVLAFICYSCGNDFFDTYTFENPVFGNLAYTMLYILIPLLYPIQALVRWIFKKVESRQ